jgi:oligopeptidase B
VNPPEAKRVEHRREHHGDVFIDPYEWLRDKSNPEVIDYLKAENDYTEHATGHLEPLRQKIFDEIKARTKETDLSVPTRRGDWWSPIPTTGFRRSSTRKPRSPASR